MYKAVLFFFHLPTCAPSYEYEYDPLPECEPGCEPSEYDDYECGPGMASFSFQFHFNPVVFKSY